MYLLDTNIWLEELLDQDRAQEVTDFFSRIPADQLLLSDFSFHSIGVICSRLKMGQVFRVFTEDVLLRSGVALVRLSPSEILEVPDICERYNLDFDDAYQYAIAGLYGADIVSFDRDFDKTPRGRKDPVDV